MEGENAEQMEIETTIYDPSDDTADGSDEDYSDHCIANYTR